MKKIRNILLLLLLLLVTLNIILLIPGFKSSIYNVSNFFNQIIHNIESTISNSLGFLADQKKLVENNNQLVNKNQSLEDNNTFLTNQINELENKNKELESQLELEQINHDYEYINAEIIQRNIESWNKEVTINKGTNDGVKEGDGVLYKGILFGFVSDVEKTYSHVTLITDPNLSQKLPVSSSGAKSTQGFLKEYNENTNTFIFEPLSIENSIEIGDLILTNEYTKKIISGIEIGIVTNIEGEGANQKIFVEPTENSQNADYVTVITNG